jgi:hypothetical protein
MAANGGGSTAETSPIFAFENGGMSVRSGILPDRQGREA